MIEINNLTTNPIDEEFLRKVAKKVLKEENKNLAFTKNLVSRSVRLKEGTALSIALVSQGKIKELNKKYKKKNRATDVLAFPDKELGLGEIVICPREVKKNARRFGLTFEKELARILIHGILHLLGENHEKAEKQAKKMEAKENHYLKIIFNKI